MAAPGRNEGRQKMTAAAHPDTTETGIRPWTISYGAMAVLVIGFLARVYLMIANPIVNPDGFLYIQQAKAIYLGRFDQTLSCYEYLSPYPLFIIAAYRLLGNWVAAAQWVNILFGTAAIVPVYWLLKRFFDDRTAWLTALVFALIPAFVLVSRDMLRGPMFWFFAAVGLHLFVLNLEARRTRWLLLSNICFAVGAWCRIEGSLFIIASAIFLLLAGGKHRFRDLTVFMAPCLAAAAIGGLIGHLLGIDLINLLKPARLLSRPMEFFHQYHTLRDQLEGLYGWHGVDSAPFFFPRVRDLVWWIALGTLLVQLVETLLYLFFIVLAVGVVSWRRRIFGDRRVLYLGGLSLLSLALLYSQIIYNWAMTSRFLAVFLLPAFIFMGAGIERLNLLLASRFRFGNNQRTALLCALILVSLLPKTISANYVKEKLIFRQIAGFIADREADQRAVTVCGAFKRVRVIHFFANMNARKAPCFDTACIIHATGAPALQQALAAGCDYFVWNQTDWGEMQIESIASDLSQHFIRLHAWPSGEWGRLILYEVRR
jgi:4-amino-4-deoxy-L-arabinose transferase-like glycosyltransferase